MPPAMKDSLGMLLIDKTGLALDIISDVSPYFVLSSFFSNNLRLIFKTKLKPDVYN